MASPTASPLAERKKAGSYQYKADEYFENQAGGSLLVGDWMEKQAGTLRSAAYPDHGHSGVFSPKSALKNSDSAGLLGKHGKAHGGSRRAKPPVVPDWRPKQALKNVTGQEGWDWCLAKGNLMSPSDLAPPPAPPGAPELGRSLSSPSMLTEEGARESVRVLGAQLPQYQQQMSLLASVGRQATEGSRPSSAAQRAIAAAASDYTVPMTCNQIYGSRWKTAEKVVTKFAKNSCEECVFVDNMHKTKTQYCPQIRF
eukprot:TRINITY_DN78706_c0_g1_i1.p1 TRINITY_DN78706_c0_g1~~TRINITY_DN78706_c0_g1_i1.p1  ORF type:complete len:255 (-),score=48.80 TRINITY_DN78706_c0_g1_i1:106-870(-)